MVFSFIKGAKRHKRVEFFHCSYRNFTNANAVIEWFSQNASRGRHGSSSGATKNYLKIDVGHYGLYFSIFNHDRDRSSRQPRVNELILTHLANYEDSKAAWEHIVVVCDKLIITRANVDIQSIFSRLKLEAKRFQSPLSILLKSGVQLRHQRLLHTKVRNVAKVVPKLEVIEDEVANHVEQELQPIDEYLASQLAALVSAEDNMVYPIYQSIKREGYTLPSIEHYNLVLLSVATRSLDSEADADTIERKLTTLMTVYQDMLSVFKPNSTTYNIVIGELCQGTLKVPGATTQFAEVSDSAKSKEIAQMAVNMFISIPHYHQLDMDTLWPQLVAVAAQFPSVMTKELVDRIMKSSIEASSEYFHQLIDISKHFGGHGVTPSFAYQFVLATYENYKGVAGNSDEFAVYASVVASMMANGQRAIAGKFLDDILSDYKQVLVESLPGPSKAQVSMVMSAYLQATLDFTSSTKMAIAETLGVLRKFEQIPYLPEVSCDVYGAIIARCLHRYRELDGQRRTNDSPAKVNEAMALQSSYYTTAWKLYNRMAVRHDFGGVNARCRDALLSLSLDVGDHEHVFQLIKEILMRSHHIYDVVTLRKILNYLYSGTVANSSESTPYSQHYWGLLWQVIESQAQIPDKHFSDYVSEVARYMVLQPHDPKLAQSVYSANVDMLVNSPVVARAVETMDLTTGNLYGVSVLASFLAAYPPEGPAAARVAHLLSMVCVQFEDPDNHYVELNRELMECKFRTMYAVKRLVPTVSPLTAPMVDAARYVDFVIPENAQVSVAAWMYTTDLTYLLSINREVGMRKFHELFGENKLFNQETWEMVLTPEYVASSPIAPKRIIERVVASEADEVLKQLAAADHDPMTIAITNYCLCHASVVSDELVAMLLAAVEMSDNRYLREKVLDGLFYKVMSPYTSSWTTQYLNMASDDVVSKLVEQERIDVSGDAMLPYLNSLVNTNPPRFLQVFEQMSVTQQTSVGAQEAMTRYKLSQPNPDYEGIISIIEKFDSKTMGQLLAEAKFYANQFKVIQCKSVEELGWTLLGGSTLEDMRKVMLANRSLMSAQHTKDHKDKLVNSMLASLTSAVAKVEATVVKNKLNNTLKFFKMVHLQKLSVSNLAQFIKLMGVAHLDDLLYILRTKLIEGDVIADVVRFFYFETVCATAQEKQLLVSELNQAEVVMNNGI